MHDLFLLEITLLLMSKTHYFILLLIYIIFFVLPFQQFTGTWLKGKDVPMEFVTVPEHYVFEKKLIICDRYAEIPFVYVYNSELNEWDTVKMKPRPGPLLVQVHHLCLKMPKRKNKLVSLYLGEYYSLCIMWMCKWT